MIFIKNEKLIIYKEYIMKKYACSKCTKEFDIREDYKNHKKTCVGNKTTLNELTTVFKACLNILRNNETITGMSALTNFTNLLTMKCIEPYIDNVLNMTNYNYNFDHIEDDCLENYKTKLFHVLKFSNLSNEPDENLPNCIKYLWQDILSKHPITQKIFLQKKEFDIKNQRTYRELINQINSINFNNTDYDVLGCAYEEVIKDVMVGKTFGQFFTQPIIKKIMVELIDPQIKDDGTIETCCDPTAGTGGFLITYLMLLLKKFKDKNIEPNWNFIKNQGLCGIEKIEDTYYLAMSNMLISSGCVFNNLIHGDSLTTKITNTFDNVLANPPFGIKINYDELHNENIPIRINNAFSLFLQVIIHMLKINGKCAIVCPDGQDLFSTTKSYVLIREYLLKTCDLKEIIYLREGIFTHTGVKTCILYFIKKVESNQVIISRTEKLTSDNKILNINYVFSDEYQTTDVTFYNYNDETHEKKTILKVPITDIINNKHILSHNYYSTKTMIVYKKNIEIKPIKKIFTFLSKSKRLASYGKQTGKYNFYTSSMNCTKYCDEYDYEPLCIIVGTGGNANIKMDKMFSCSADNIIMTCDNDETTTYVYYYLLLNINLLQDGFVGSGIQHISNEYFKNINIPLPSIKKQNKIIEYMINIENENKELIKKIKNNKLNMRDHLTHTIID